jgi:putative addiction module component (TIGR02574 family)
MIGMDVKSVKTDLIHWLTELQDKSVLKKLQALKDQQESSFKLSTEQLSELENRLEKYENGEIEFSPWDTVKDRIRKRAKDAL